MTPPLVPPGRGPLASRLQGLHILFTDSTMRLRALIGVAEDVSDGVLEVVDTDREAWSLIVTSLASEVASLERLLERLRPLVDELRARS